MTEREKANETLKNAIVKLNIAKRMIGLRAKELHDNNPILLESFLTCFGLCDAYNESWSESLDREEKLEKEVTELKEKLHQAETRIKEILNPTERWTPYNWVK